MVSRLDTDTSRLLVQKAISVSCLLCTDAETPQDRQVMERWMLKFNKHGRVEERERAEGNGFATALRNAPLEESTVGIQIHFFLKQREML